VLTPDPAFDLSAALRLPLVVLASAVAGAVNSIAGGGTLLTFPALVGLGISPIVANATSTIALWPGALGSMWGYRRELDGMGGWAVAFALPSLAGGLVGAWLLLRTPPDRFAALVPWLVLGATVLFIVQGPITRRLGAERGNRVAGRGKWEAGSDSGERLYAEAVPVNVSVSRVSPSASRFPLPVLFYQFLVAIYGGYFGAGVGILMLAALGFAGFSNIHQMNGLKNWGGLCMNAVAAITFAFSDIVNWPVALAMAVGALLGGYAGSLMAQRVPQRAVRRAIVVIGLTSGVWLMVA
jgi:uncharacterized membrane protein YfcA